MWHTPVGRVRGVGLIEGCSALLLFLVAMPLKYMTALQGLSGQPMLGKSAVTWVGSIHGALFIAYALVAFWAWGRGYLSSKLLGLAAIASIVPFGPFLLEHKLKETEPIPPDAAR